MESQYLGKFTSIGRLIDPRHPTNLAIVGLTALVAVGAGLLELLSGAGLLQAFQSAFQISAGFFISWVIGREVDPDYEYSAFVGPVLTLIGLGLGVAAEPSLLLLVWLILSLRILNRSVGLPAKLVDSLGALLIAALLVAQGNWLAGVFTALAFALDAWLEPPNRRQAWFAGLALLGTILWLALGPGPGSPDFDPPSAGAALAIALLFLPVLQASSTVECVGDATGERLHGHRVQAGQILALLAGLALVVWEGQEAFAALLPLWAAILGAAAYRAAASLIGRRR